jgi:general nucleoside transport system ATP-binding protein
VNRGDGAGSTGSPPLVVLENMTKRFPGVLANDRVSLELRAGEVHALIGENGAGKSTLMRVLYGMYPADEGRIVVRGQDAKIGSPRDAIALGIGMVHQHFVLVDPFTVTENIILGEEGSELLDLDEAQRRVADLAESYGFRVDPRAVVEDLSVGEEQRVEILKALYRGVEILILDEPTAVLTPSEAQDLFGNLRRLREAGRTIVFISHKLDEVLEIADRITVLRRGRVVGETTPAETTKAKLAEMMVGRPVLFRLEKPDVQPGDAVVRVDELQGEGKLNGVSLEVRAGEILGVAGVEGNGQRELAETLIGLRAAGSGTIELEGTSISGRSVEDIRNAGVGYIPEDRHEQGLVLTMTLWENSVLGRQDDPAYSNRFGVLFIKKIKALAAKLIELFDVRARSVDVTASTLSGGNQQKLILARELDPDPKFLIAAQPTRGLDVGAIEFVWKQILDQKAAGRAVLLISAELDEIYALSDRIVTLYDGRITGEFPPDAPPEEVGVGMLGGAAVRSVDGHAGAPSARAPEEQA